MKSRLAVILRIAMIGWAFLVTAAAVFGCAPAAVPKANIDEMVGNAKTASDHEAIAQYYEREAADARAESEEHEMLAIRYERNPRSLIVGWHCYRLAEKFRVVEEESSAPAAEHHKIAEEMNSGRRVPRAPAVPDRLQNRGSRSRRSKQRNGDRLGANSAVHTAQTYNREG